MFLRTYGYCPPGVNVSEPCAQAPLWLALGPIAVLIVSVWSLSPIAVLVGIHSWLARRSRWAIALVAVGVLLLASAVTEPSVAPFFLKYVVPFVFLSLLALPFARR